MKTIILTGKGGVGKSTMSAATAWQLAQQGKRVLAISFDPAHNLGDIFGVNLSHKRTRFTDNLYLQEADLDRAAQDYIKKNTDILTEVYSYTKAFNLDRYFKVLRYSPGVEEYASLTALEELLRTSDEFDIVVIDTPPTGLTLRILALPRITMTWIDRLRRIRRDILDKRHTVHSISGVFKEEGELLAYTEADDNVMKKLQELFERYLIVAQHIEGPNSQLGVVFNPDYLSLRESQRIFVGLNDLKIGIDVALNNKYTPGLESIADEMEKELFKGITNPPLLARVPWEPYRREKSYEIGFDLTALFTQAARE
jgi:arsenite/tail-anchored protein-transporting ATPase